MNLLKSSVFALILGSSFVAAPAGADHHTGHDHSSHSEHSSHDHSLHGDGAGQADAAGSSAHGSEGEGSHGEGAHGDSHGHGGHHVPTFKDINWFHGLIGEKEGVEPSLLWRPPGTPIPIGALFINTAILFFLIGRFGGPGIRQGLKDRKQRIAGDIEKAAAMKVEAEEQLAHYEEKLSQMEAEMERIKKEMAEQAEADRERILKDAKERREAIEREAREMIEQELAQARHDATMKAVTGAVEAAREQVIKNLNSQDQDRLAKDFLGSLESEVKKSEVRS